jgi:hypothetical protein
MPALSVWGLVDGTLEFDRFFFGAALRGRERDEHLQVRAYNICSCNMEESVEQTASAVTVPAVFGKGITSVKAHFKSVPFKDRHLKFVLRRAGPSGEFDSAFF